MAVATATAKFHCEICEQEFKAGDWICVDGQSKHVVPRKEYLLNDAPADPGHGSANINDIDVRRWGMTRICNIPPDKQIKVGDEVKLIPGGYVEFVQGRFSTTDPEIQYYLDRKGGWCDQAAWERSWLAPSQQIALERQRMNAEKERIENENNRLLAEVQRMKKEKAGARA